LDIVSWTNAVVLPWIPKLKLVQDRWQQIRFCLNFSIPLAPLLTKANRAARPCAPPYKSTTETTTTQQKTIMLLQYWWKQDWTMLCCPHCSQLPTILNNVITPDSGSTILFILLTSVNNVGSKTLFNPVEQWARHFLPCI
jgi:hypothetical protein